MTKEPFPSVLSSTILAAFKSCPQKAFKEFFQHWKSKEPSVHLHAGLAFAEGLEKGRVAFFVDGKPPAEAEAIGLAALLTSYGDFPCPAESPKSAERMAGALEYYYSMYPMQDDPAVPMTLPGGKRGIEFSFLEPLEIPHPTSGDPILYSGRLDMMVDFEGMHLGEDDKTTSQLGASWPRQWDLRSQFTSYVWGAQRAGIKLDGFLIRGISILKSKYDTLQAITHRPQWTIDRWYEQTHRDVKRMVRMWDEGYFDYSLDNACAEYGGCQFRNVCQMRDPTPLLVQQFQRRKRDPVTRTEIILGEGEV